MNNRFKLFRKKFTPTISLVNYLIIIIICYIYNNGENNTSNLPPPVTILEFSAITFNDFL